MGEAKRKNRRKQAFLKEHPYCCFCGGATPATTIDHVPSRQLFSLKRRPKGLEVPACHPCNQSTRGHEQVVAMVSRLFPDPQTDAEQAEAFHIIVAIDRYIPGLLKEMVPSVRQEQRFVDTLKLLPAGAAGALNCSGPLLNQSIQAFGVKLGLALYYATTNGLIVPKEGGVAVKWYSNFDAVTGGIPNNVFQLLGPPKTLSQGKWGVGDQFSYAYAVAESARMAAYFATFRKSFAVLCWVCRDVSSFDGVDDSTIHRPGRVGS